MDKRTILIIDDAMDVRKILRFHLEKKYNVSEARDGQEGLEIISNANPDLLILDINMPRMGGIELYNKISVGTGKPLFPVIILTVREELGSLFKDLNVDGFVTKPFDIEYVLREIDTIMAKRYGQEFQEKPKAQAGPKKVLIIENDTSAFNKIAVAFLNEGYLVSSAKSGMGAIEKIMVDLPDLIVIKLGLPDISGDLICVKLKQMPKTMDIPIVLYTPPSSSLDRVVVKKICEIANSELIESDDADILLREAEKAISKPV